MNLEDLKDRLKTDLQSTWERLQESEVYNKIVDRYENMTPSMQKLTLAGIGVVISIVILNIPFSSYQISTENIDLFEGQRATLRELLKVSRESSTIPDIPQAPTADVLQNHIQNQIQAANLLPEQIKGTSVANDASPLIPKNLVETVVQVSLAKLNLRQALDLGYNFQSFNSSVKLKDMTMTANREDARYFDVVYKLITLAVPAPPVVEEAPANPRGRRGGQ